MNRYARFDNHGRRAGADRRQFSYALYIPERRMDPNRRTLSDRRLKPRGDDGWTPPMEILPAASCGESSP